MSEHGLHKALMGAALSAALFSAAPAAADTCAPLSAHFTLCADAPLWSEARWNPFGGGAALESDPYYIEFYEHWAGRTEGATLDAAPDAFLAELHELDHEVGMALPEMLLRDGFNTAPLEVVRAVQSVDRGDDQPMHMATMIAEGTGARLVVVFSHDDAVTLDTVSDKAHAFVALIRPGQEG